MKSNDETKVEGKKLDILVKITLAVECRKMSALLVGLKDADRKAYNELADITDEELSSAINLMDKIVNKTSTTKL